MVFKLLKGKKQKNIEKRFTTFSEQLAQAFAQIKTDLGELNSRLESNQAEMERVSQWIEYLNRANQRVSDSNTRILQKYDEITENHQKLHTSHRDLHQEHSRTAEIAVEAAGTAETLKNNHEELSKAILAHKHALKSEFNDKLQEHKEEALEHKESSDKELERMKTWVDYLSTHLDAQKRKEGDLKQDIAKMEQQWVETYSALRGALNGLEGENSELKSTMANLKKDVLVAREDLENTRKMAKNTIIETKSELSDQIESLRELTNSVKKSAEVAQQAPRSMPEPIPQPSPQPIQPINPVVEQMSAPTASFQRHIMSRVLPNRKGYVIKFIMDMISENKYSTKEIEETIVNEKQLCGRTSFYAYLKELKLKGRVSYAEIDERQILISTDSQQTLSTLSERISPESEDNRDFDQ